MKFKTLWFALTLCVFGVSAQAQNGIIRGKIFDDATGEDLIGVTVMVVGTDKGSITDFEGTFQIAVEPGVYDLQVSYISFTTITISDVAVKAGETTVFDGIRLKESIEELEAVVVTAEVINNSESAMLTVKRKSANVLDGISSQGFSRMGTSDAASAVKTVTGVSVEGGKYVYVRGLGDRYTKTLLNGMDVPGLDPDRNTIQMDIFPTNVVDNIIVLKSFTPDQPADFTGGVVNIETKDFPEERTMKLSGSIGINPAMHFNANYLDYDVTGGSMDWLGFGAASRQIPNDRSTAIPVSKADGVSRPSDYNEVLGNFDPVMGAISKNSLFDGSISLSAGNQFMLGSKTLGYNFAVSYSNSTEYYTDVEQGRYAKSNDLSETELTRRILQTGSYGMNDVLVSGMAGLAYKSSGTRYKLNVLRLQNGESKAGIWDINSTNFGSNFMAYQHNLEYSQRSLTNILLNGEHNFSDHRWNIEWKLAPTWSSITDPDIRVTRFRTDNGRPQIGTESGLPERIWRYLDEFNMAGRLDFTRKFTVRQQDASFKFGGGHTYKERQYEIQSFQIDNDNQSSLTGDPNELFLEENLWDAEQGFASNGTFYRAQFIPINGNKFDANVNSSAAYGTVELVPVTGLRAILGLRYERFVQHYTGSNSTGSEVLDNERVLNDSDLFPAANLIYSLTEAQNLRFSYSQTIARPSFKEVSYAQIIDPISGITFNGALFVDTEDNMATGVADTVWDGNIISTRIRNFDLRWELFHGRGQTISIGGFYKQFDKPIEIVQMAKDADNLQPRNVGNGSVQGIELEVRQSLSFITPGFDNLSANANVTLTNSEIRMSPTEYNSRVRNAREGESISNTRVMAGQAPLIVNAGLSYNNEGLDIGMFYNVQSTTLTYVGINRTPDVYVKPFNSLNLNASQKLGSEGRMSVGFGVTNILGSKRVLVYQSFGDQEEIFRSLNPGREFKLNFGYSF